MTQEKFDKQRQTEIDKQELDKHYKFNVQTTRLLEIHNIKQEDITAYLEWCGFSPVQKTAKITYFVAPWRSEENPSLAVYHTKKQQDWYDYGENVGGSIIDLAKKLHGGYVEGMRSLRKYCEMSSQ